jgi:NAD(P)-dependent dehydrogenase (short-subunit alcohol dehydrogenase family)
MDQADRQVVIVTGAASGIGRGIALRFAEQRARVVIADVDESGAEETSSTIRNGGGDALVVPTDVARAADAERLIAETLKAYGRIDVLVNNAAILVSKSVADTSPEEWERVIGVNLTGAFLCSHYALPTMLAQGSGVIIHIASPHAFQTGNTIAAYAASKGGIVALTRQMAMDYGRLGVRVNCVVPGAIDTPMLHADVQAGADAESNVRGWEEKEPIGRLGQPVDVARVVAWLASPESGFVLGTSIVADGGLLAQLVP